jgi:phage-related protein
MIKWKIKANEKESGEKPVEDFLRSLPGKHRAKAIWEIDLLSEYGTQLAEPYCKAIRGSEYAGIWELRIKFASDISRVFYFAPYHDTFVLLHGFIKKTDKTPKRELDTAKGHMNDYERRFLTDE